jgi:hypothetical protein
MRLPALAPFTGLSAQRCRPGVHAGFLGEYYDPSPVHGASRSSASANPRSRPCPATITPRLICTLPGTPRRVRRSWFPKSRQSCTTACAAGALTRRAYMYMRSAASKRTCISQSVSCRRFLISEFVGQLKGASAHEANQKLGHKVVEWQTGYGVVSFGTKDLPWVMDYVRNQRDRHARGQIAERLERITAIETRPENG